MCCVIGYAPHVSGLEGERKLFFGRLMMEARIRGTHAFGIASYDSRYAICTEKSHDVEHIIQHFDPCDKTIAHARYSTSGDYLEPRNNQPLTIGDMSLVFNGVIHMGTREEFSDEYGVECVSDNDGEVFLRRLQKGQHPIEFLDNFRGSFAGLWLADGSLNVMRNDRRPLWEANWLDAQWFASTRDIFARAGLPEGVASEVRPMSRIIL